MENNNTKKEVMSENYERIREIVSLQLDVPFEDVTLEKSFGKDLDADSLDFVEMLMAIEDEFDLEIPDEDAEKIATVKDALEYVEARV